MITAMLTLALMGAPTATPPPPKPKIKATAKCPRRHDRCMRAVVIPYRPWLRGLRACESGDRNINGQFDGYYQFHPGTWNAVDSGYAYQHTKLRQSFGVVLWLRRIGWANRGTTAGWPNCSPF